MESTSQSTPVAKKVWAGRVISALPVLMLLFSATMKLLQPASLPEQMKHLGYPFEFAVWLGLAELSCTLIYLIPRTSVLGAILLTGYLGGATATHVRIGEPFYLPVLAGVLVWVGLLLRDDRLSLFLPLRTPDLSRSA